MITTNNSSTEQVVPDVAVDGLAPKCVAAPTSTATLPISVESFFFHTLVCSSPRYYFQFTVLLVGVSEVVLSYVSWLYTVLRGDQER